MSGSPYSFVAFIDEAGDEGFNIVPHPERKSSQWFALSALVFRTRQWGEQSRIIGRTTNLLEANGKKIHFSKLKHEQRLPVIQCIAESRGVAMTVCVNKAELLDGRPHGLGRERRLYFYSTRMLLERISWFARENREAGQGNGKTKLVFAHCKSLSYEKMTAYLRLLRSSDVIGRSTQISWDHVEVVNVSVLQHADALGLRLADAVVSGIQMGLELSPYGFCEDRYARLLKPSTYCRNGKYLSYGLKFFPVFPTVEPARDNRYAWIYEVYKQQK